MTIRPLISIILLFIFNCCTPQQNDVKDIAAENHIEVDTLTNNVIIVKVFSDAVIAISTEKGIVVVDAGISNSLTSKYREIIEREFKRSDFAYLINTHPHWDHTSGNQVFKDAEIIGHENCINEMQTYWKDIEKIKAGVRKTIDDYDKRLKTFDPQWEDSLDICIKKNCYQHVYADLMNDRVVTVPTKTFKDTMTISLGDVNFNMIYFGKAHSSGDILIHIPEEKILMVGDLFSKYGRPSISQGAKIDAARWKIVKQWISKRLDNINIVISGHGQIMEKEDLLLFSENIEKKTKEL